MPEIKNTFVGGKMNKDLNERLMPNGQYANAFNIEVSTAEGSGIGIVKNIIGNKRVDITSSFSGVPSGFTCVGTVANEKTNKLYWFVTKAGEYAIDAIVEYDAVNDVVALVVVDLNAGNSKAVLKFGVTPIITGINIIDNLLLWTDNQTDPKKINIDECKKGTGLNNNGEWQHTQLKFENGSFDGVTCEHLIRGPNDMGGNPNFLEQTTPYGRYFFFQYKQMSKALGIPDGFVDTSEYYVRQYRDGRFLRRIKVKLWGFEDSPVSSNGTHGRIAESDPNFAPWVAGHVGDDPRDFHMGDVIYGDNISVDIEERHITVIKPKPLLALTTKIKHTRAIEAAGGTPNLFETKFPRFSYRYKFRDGEFSAFAPFTNAVFNPKYPKDINNSTGTSVFYNRDNVYDENDPSNKAMANSIHSIELGGFISANTPQDVVAVDVLYKQENSSVIYSIGTIKHNDPEWHLTCDAEGYDLGFNKTIGPNDNYYAAGGYTKGRYMVTTENIYAALPADQLLRPWDNVPRKALAQEVTGNRIVYGNYLQNYDLGDHKTEIKVSYGDRKINVGSFETQGLPSIKSQRNYQLGVVYSDKFGRETPVFTSSGGAIAVPWADSNGLKNASRSLQVNASVAADFPTWVDSMKFYIKETSKEYYNLVMNRAWIVEKTYELDNSEGHLWISFPSSDRNKVSEGDYIVLKKKIGVGESQVPNENKFKIIDISNEAPESIKYELVEQGSTGNTTFLTGMLDHADLRPDVAGNNGLIFEKEDWITTSGLRGVPLEDGENQVNTRLRVKDLYVSWSRISGVNSISSKKYKVVSGRLNTGGENYVLKLQNKISVEDADIAHENGDSSQVTLPTILHTDLVFKVEKREVRSGEDFSGSFFVKISKNQVTDVIESGSTTTVLDNHQVSAKTPIYWWRDNVAGNSGNGTTNEIRTNEWDHGINNYNGYDTGSHAGDNDIQHADNNTVGNGGTSASIPYLTDYMRLTDFSEAWDGLYDNYVTNDVSLFVLDAMHMVAAQSEASDYAKYCCVTWSGAHKDLTASHNIIKGDSAWSYPPLKTWLGSHADSDNIIENLVTDSPLLFNNKLITTSDVLNVNDEWGANKVDGWIGHSQHVKRRTNDDPGSGQYSSHAGLSQVNGLEGLVTSQEDHSINGRRWFSGITGNDTEFGVGVDTKTYSDDGEVGRYFMHLSFFAPGVDLFDSNAASADDFELFGDNAVGARLQGIWGGGHFTGEHALSTFGTNATPTHSQVCLEGNYDDNLDFLPEPPGPGVGFGYDLKYKESHERQWDPTFPSDPGNRIRDFVKNLHSGSQFVFNPDQLGHPNTTAATKLLAKNSVYTIKSVKTKKLYNHTSWRNTFNRWEDGEGYPAPNDPTAYWSVERAAMDWLDNLDNDGTNDAGAGYIAAELLMKTKFEDFGKNHNRRICYVIELDKDPTADGNFNPIDTNLTTGGRLTADQDSNEFHNIEFLEKVKDVAGVNDLNKFPAVWETDPSKEDVDLDIYFEASGNIPVRINDRTNETFAPLGCVVEPLNAPAPSTSHLIEWNGFEATFEPGFSLTDGVDEINYSNVSFKFTKNDGSFVIAKADTNILTGFSSDPHAKKTTIVFRENIGEDVRVGLGWNNCFSFGNGLESNRIKDDFNEMFLLNGVRASITTQQTYEEERRSTGLIYSGLYNSNSGVNNLNQFTMAEKITKDLNPTFGSIQKLFQRRISLVAFCEDRVVSITSNKDAIYNADGNSQLIASNRVLGDANPFEGNFGISKNPESFASESYRAYFTDKNRGAVIRLSKDGLTPISDSGMSDWFRDNLPQFDALIGTFDSYKENYNITLSDTFGENLLSNSFLGLGTIDGTVSGGFANKVINPVPTNGLHMEYPYEEFNVLDHNNFLWSDDNDSLTTKNIVVNHAEIGIGDVYEQINSQAAVYGTPVSSNPYSVGVGPGVYQNYNYSFMGSSDATVMTTTYTVTAGASATYTSPTFLYGSAIPEGGTLFGGLDVFTTPAPLNFLFAPSGNSGSVDPNNYCLPVRHMDPNGTNNGAGSYNLPLGAGWFLDGPAGWITEESSTGRILFNRLYQQPGQSGFVEFRSLGDDPSTPFNFPGTLDNPINTIYNSHPDTPGNAKPSAMFNGDEITVSIEIETEDSQTGSGAEFNMITPRIELRNGPGNTSGGVIPAANFLAWNGIAPGTTGSNANNTGNNFEFIQDPNQWLFSGYNYWLGQGTKIAEKAYVSSSVVDFPQTLTAATTYIATVGFKFKSTTQSGPDQVAEKIVDDLVVRVMNVGANGSSATYPNGMHRPKWKLKGLYVKKTNAIQSPGEAAFQDPNTTTYAFSANVANTNVETAAVVAVDAIPTSVIPAWTEVKNYAINGWTLGNIQYTNNSYRHANSTAANALGNTYAASVQTATPNDASGNPVSQLTWLEPGTLPTNGSPHGTTGYTGNGIPAAIPNSPGNYQGYTAAYANGNANNVINEFPNEYWRVRTTGADARFDFTNESATDQWVDGAWYLIDIEYEDDSFNSAGVAGDTLTGTGGGHGVVVVHGVASEFLGTHGTVVDPEGVGTHSLTTSNNSNIAMVPTVRTEYGAPGGGGDNRTVLRAIFQFKGDSWRAGTAAYRKQVVLRFSRFTDGTVITKIITRKLSEISSGGTAVDWTHSTDNVPHSFSKRSVYYEDNSLCWENSTGEFSNQSTWHQEFATGDAPQTSAKNWRVRFKVDDNPNLPAGNMSGSLNLQINNAIGDASTTEFDGLTLGGITDVGVYEFTFNMSGAFGDTHADGTPIWTATKSDINGNNTTPWTGYSIFNSTSGQGNSQTEPTYSNRIRFWGGTNSDWNVAPLTACVSDILLTDETLVLTGGTAGSWSWNGFDDALDDFITWDTANGRIQYNSCPVTDPSYITSGSTIQTSASQYIPLVINKNEKYEISISHGLTSGKLSIYYFNSEGHGFRVLNIEGSDTTTVTRVVGEDTWASVNPADPSYALELKSTFVIRPHNTSADVNGWIDDITMVRQYDLSAREPVTASFSEKTNGWTSFKSFIPENGLSLSKKYYTFKYGGLWQHYKPLVDGADSSVDEANNYGNFYNISYPASITAVLNNEPSVVKVFNTLNYEGSQSYVKLPTLVGDASTEAHITAVDQVTINNILAWNNFNAMGAREDLKGWSCAKIETDLEAGSVEDFINKEGKWFAYIKGENKNASVDTKLFSVQGIGKASTVAIHQY
tara:strand:+ start:2186 stop:11755 length:9570 start_codon:yes stop_codon:yes gene_type:complete